MQLAPEIQAIYAAEQTRRSLAWLRLEFPLCGSKVGPLTLRILTELQFAKNAFVTGEEPTRADVFDVLWRLHPAFYRPGCATLSRWWARRQLVRRVRRLSVTRAAMEIRVRFAAWRQDEPGTVKIEGGAPSLLSARVHMVDDFICHFGQYFHLSPDEVLDYPLAALYQLYRQQAINAGKEVIDRSASIVGEMVRAQWKGGR